MTTLNIPTPGGDTAYLWYDNREGQEGWCLRFEGVDIRMLDGTDLSPVEWADQLLTSEGERQ